MHPEVRHPQWHLVGSRNSTDVGEYLSWIANAALVVPGVVIDVDPMCMGASSRIPTFDKAAARLDEVGVSILDGQTDEQILNVWPRIPLGHLTVFRALITTSPPPRIKP